jgi:hypothetical protein
MIGIMKFVTGRSGASRIKTLITLAIMAAVVYTAIKFIPPYVDYLKMKNAAYDTMNSVGDKGDDVILQRFMRMAKDIKPELAPENVTIERGESGPATLLIDYSVTVVLIKDKLEKVLNFHIAEKAS